MAEHAGDFGKLRMPLPKTFSGDPSDWEEWEWNFKSYLAICQPDATDFLVRAETSDVEIIDAHFATALQQEEAVEMRMFPGKLHCLLANFKGKSDSDWAGCATPRPSASRMALYFLVTLITSQSRTQATVALSSGEAELYAIVLGVSESLFIRSLLLESQLSKNCEHPNPHWQNGR